MTSSRKSDNDKEYWPEDASWHRRKSENDASWMAFFTYLCLPLQERTINAAWQQFSGNTTKAPGRWFAWSRIHHWPERVVDFERWKLSREQMREESERAAETRRWEEIRSQERERLLKTGQALLDKAAAMMQFPLAEVERVVSVYPDGNPKEVQIFRPAGWNFGTVARMIEVGSKLVQLMSQMATEHHRVDLSLIYQEAEKVAQQIGGGTTREDVLAMAERIVQEHQERSDEEGTG